MSEAERQLPTAFEFSWRRILQIIDLHDSMIDYRAPHHAISIQRENLSWIRYSDRTGRPEVYLGDS
jgi:hypothetical protein